MEGFVSHVDAPTLVALQCEFPPIRDKQKGVTKITTPLYALAGGLRTEKVWSTRLHLNLCKPCDFLLPEQQNKLATRSALLQTSLRSICPCQLHQKFKDLRVCSLEHPIPESPLRFEQRTYKEPSQGLTPVTSSEILYPAAAPLCLTRVKFPGAKAFSLFV
jgi:hypothetical protein